MTKKCVTIVPSKLLNFLTEISEIQAKAILDHRKIVEGRYKGSKFTYSIPTISINLKEPENE